MWRSCIAAGHKAVQHADPALFSGLLGSVLHVRPSWSRRVASGCVTGDPERWLLRYRYLDGTLQAVLALRVVLPGLVRELRESTDVDRTGRREPGLAPRPLDRCRRPDCVEG